MKLYLLLVGQLMTVFETLRKPAVKPDLIGAVIVELTPSPRTNGRTATARAQTPLPVVARAPARFAGFAGQTALGPGCSRLAPRDRAFAGCAHWLFTIKHRVLSAPA